MKHYPAYMSASHAPYPQTQVNAVFTSVAGKYDIMNDAMSLGVHRLWKQQFITKLRPRPQERFLDVAGGTGDIAFLIARQLAGQLGHAPAPGQITVSDINPDMLKVGEARAIDQGLTTLDWLPANAEAIPLPDHSIDAYTIAFGLRNVNDRQQALAEAYRLVKPGGRFFCMEFSHVCLPWLAKLYDLYSDAVIPKLGGWLAGDAASYRYLVDSIRAFPGQEQLAHMLRDAGFSRVRYTNLSAGIVAIHQGMKI